MINYNYGTGKRKTSIARVFMKKGQGIITINNLKLNDYIFDKKKYLLIFKPLVLSKLENNFDLKISVSGGGVSSQLDAIRLGITRAIIDYDESLKSILRHAGLVTRDSRIVERKKVGFRKSRKQRQFSKR